MSIDPKHFEDIDDFCDFDDKLEAAVDGDISESGPNHPLSWRRVIIEKAVNNVKKALEHKADVKASYKKGDLVFDEEANKFGRVVESRPGFLNLSLLGGGKLIRQDVNPIDFVRAHRQKLTLPEMAEKLFITEIEILSLLNQLELEGEKVSEIKAKPSTSKMPKKQGLIKAKTLKKPLEVRVVTHDKSPLKAPPLKLAAKKKDFSKKKNIVSKDNLSFTKLLPKGATTDPVRDPNGYIQQNFLMMSNRELAVATGLSEHTIRRKLGEWNLKRKDFVNKA